MKRILKPNGQHRNSKVYLYESTIEMTLKRDKMCSWNTKECSIEWVTGCCYYSTKPKTCADGIPGDC